MINYHHNAKLRSRSITLLERPQKRQAQLSKWAHQWQKLLRWFLLPEQSWLISMNVHDPNVISICERKRNEAPNSHTS
jgi:hypothetical protein